MKYQEGRVGRLLLLRFEHEEGVKETIERLAEEKGLECGWVWLLGAFKGADLVVGPKEPVLPPEPVLRSFADGREVVATGSIFPDDEERPRLHIHGSTGKGSETLTGCIRSAQTYLVAEALVMELAGISARRLPDQESGLKLLEL